ncbi:hypothetical protein [Loktanella sp. S4079]|uniref:hypothetical protein n=1 Tax=Loktanella sp. S4079 TaxID=579483 RepID=UPI0005FA0E5C|nr:hypothetical protein [Loktanella sp. S4079]KJZ20632.1 hypothetical protein TW80_07625 [Loktanella sp. S4079]
MSKRALPRIDGWSYTRKLAGWQLGHCPTLDHTDILDANGKLIGWMLGVAVQANGQIVGPRQHHLEYALNDAQFWEKFEAEITPWAGRYVVFAITTAGKRVYFDPVTDLPAVFHRQEQCVASSVYMALSRPIAWNNRLPRRRIIRKGGRYGLQQTCDAHVFRVVSNHYLDLETFALHRHWPKADDQFDRPASDLDEVAEQIVHKLGMNTGAIVANYACALPLSGGADSRTLAYSARAHLHHVKHAFSHRISRMSKFDCYVGMRLAEDLGLADRFQLIDGVKLVETGAYSDERLNRLKWQYMERTGYYHPPSAEILAAAEEVPPAQYTLRGNIMELTRANQWPRSFEFSVEHGLSKLALGGRDTLDENLNYWGPDYQNWVDGLPASTKDRVYDFAFVEHLLPYSLGGGLLGFRQTSYLNPFNDRALTSLAISLPPQSRRKRKLNAAIHRACNTPDIPRALMVKRDEDLRREADKLFA